MADPRQALVYVMERRELWGHHYHVYPLKYLRKAERRVARLYSVPRVSIAFDSGLRCCGEYLDDTVTLHTKAGRNLLILSHELAHHVVAHRHPRAHDHGPLWMRYYVEILDILRLIPRAGMLALCLKYKLRVAPRADLTRTSGARITQAPSV